MLGSDVPPEGLDEVRLGLPIRVLGWAYSRPGIDRVDVLVDDARVRAQYGLSRNDVAEALSEPDAVRSGFAALLTSDACAAGPHTLKIVAADRDGQTAELAVEILAEDGSEAEGADWIGVDNEGERYVPEDHRGTYTEVEHQARYSWIAPLAAGRDVLDAGCGVGWGTMRLAASARRAVGLDLDERALANARQRAAGRAEFIAGDLLALPFSDGSFDLVVCYESIEHVSDPERALDEARRVLRPGGVLVVSSPNRGVYPAGNPHHLHELSSEELEGSLRRRFVNVAMYRQQTHLAAFLSDDRTYGSADPEAELPGRLFKASGGRPGDELYTVGVASDGLLAPIANVATLGGVLETKQLYEHVNALEHRVTLAETQCETVRRTFNDALRARAEAEAARDSAERSLAGLRASASWRVTRPLRTAKRAVRGERTGRGPASE